MTESPTAAGARAPDHGVTLGEAFRVWLRIGLLSFGGPAGQIALMHRMLVDERRWIGETRFLHALNYCMLLPGPEAQQLAVYVGWLMHRTVGGLVAGLLFVLPGAFGILALSAFYALYGGVGPVAALFFGLKAAVLAIVVQALVRVGRRALKGPAPLALAVLAFVAIFFLGVPFPLVVLAAGLVGLAAGVSGHPAFAAGAGHGAAAGLADRDSLLGEGTPAHARVDRGWAIRVGGACLLLWALPVVGLLLAYGRGHVLTEMALFFSKMAVVTFGGAYAVLAYVAQQAVEVHGWLAPGEMLDGLGLAETTPGPLILVLQFVGFLGAFRGGTGLPPLLAGALGAALTTWVTFAPCFLWIFLGAPFVEALRGNRALGSALSAITAAVVGVIANLALWFALHVVFREVAELRWGPLSPPLPVLSSIDPAAALLSLGALVAVLRFGAGMVPTLAVSAGIGLALHLAGLAG
jgi:chromate transporter